MRVPEICKNMITCLSWPSEYMHLVFRVVIAFRPVTHLYDVLPL